MGTRDDTSRLARRLPDVLPVFPLSTALLLPGCRLPLRIFEPRYLQMVEDVMGGDRIIGVVQPVDEVARRGEPQLEDVGCAGRIASIKEDDEGRYRISLVGIARFEVGSEMHSDRLYRLVEPNWKRFRGDTKTRPTPAEIDREELVANLRAYFDVHGLEANWRAIDESGDEELVNSLAMVCPFDSTEKQALLEAPDLEQRSRLVIALMNMSVLTEGSSTTVH